VKRGLAVVFLAACGSAPRSEPVPVVVPQAQPSAPLVVAAPVPPPPPPSIVVAPPATFDGGHKAPGMAELLGVSRDHLWVQLESPGDRDQYEAVVDNKTLCVTETRTREFPRYGDPLHAYDASDDALAAELASPKVREMLGARLGFLERFEIVSVFGAPVRGLHGDHELVTTPDRRTIAFAVHQRVFVSQDGGHRWVRADGAGPSVNAVLPQLTSDGQFLTYIRGNPPVNNGPIPMHHVVVDLRGPAPVVVGAIDLADHNFRHGLYEGRKGVFVGAKDRCFYTADPAERPLALRKVSCALGKTDAGRAFVPHFSPSSALVAVIDGDFQATRGLVHRIDGSAPPRKLLGGFDLHSASIGPDDDGRWAWDVRVGFRVATPQGTFEHKDKGTLLGFDLDGSVLVFRQPPLVAEHKPMQVMPPTKDKLADVRCKLVDRIDPLRGVRVGD
jgi:hypothetical protein